MLGAMLTFGRLLFGGGRWAFVLALGGIWLYALLSGMSPSVTRAAIMGSIYLIGRLMGREGASLPALAAAAAVMAGLNPKLLGNISFQLSFTAVTALLLLAPPLERRFTAVVERFTGTEGPSSTFGRAVAVALAAGVAATIGTLPLVALAFERVSYLGIPATLLALPALPFILVGSATTAIAGLAWAPLGVLAGWATWVPLAYLLELVGIFARVFGGSFGIGGVTPTLLWAYYGVGIVLLVEYDGEVCTVTNQGSFHLHHASLPMGRSGAGHSFYRAVDCCDDIAGR
jgi:competence protein ComEC